jgi:YVTN family beta-propeller protein
VNVRLLGPLEVHLEDGPVQLGPRQQRAVLAMLALHVGRTVSVDRLIEGLWGGDPPASAPKMLQLYVSHLRPLLERGGVLIETHGRGYELRLPGDAVDAVRFERLVEEACPREALALWRGDALVDLADEPFAADEIRRLERLRLRASEMAIDADLAAGRHDAVLGEAEALCAAEPLREHVRAQYMLALYRAGRQSDALAAYRDARERLVEEVGVEPSAELQRLHEAILAHDPALDLPAGDAEEPPVATAARPPPRHARYLLFGAAVLVLAGVTAFGVIRVAGPSSLARIDENSIGLIEPDGGRITEQIRVGAGPSAVTQGGGSVWVANGADGTVSRIDRRRSDRVTIPLGGEPTALAFGGGSLWVADEDSRAIAQVDPGANKVVARIPVGNAPRAVAVTPGAVWVASGVDWRIRRVDLRRGRVTRSVPVGANPSAIAAGAGALWVASEEAGTVTRIEPSTGDVGSPIRVGRGPSAVAVGEGAVWVTNRQDGTLSKIDSAENTVAWTVQVGRDPTGVAVGAGSVWVTGGEEGTVARVDPHAPRVIKRLRTGSSPSAVTVSGGSVWAAAQAPLAAHRGGTLRVLVPHAPGGPVPLDWLHWAAYTTWASTQVGSLAYDGLVGYRRVEGAAGTTLVGALATNVPAPTEGGRTYVFTLRRGLRFSDGRPVRPVDVRASFERYLEGTRHRAPEQASPDFFTGIAGARKCIEGHAPCDLARGIETDEPARTVTIHLARPDADFPHKLATVYGSVVPAGSAGRASAGRPPPGTGPYRVATWDARRGGTLVRNRRFRPNPSRPFGAGFPDRIEVRLYEEPSTERQIAAVQRGSADVTVIANPFASPLSAERIRALAAQSPGRIHSRPEPTGDWMFLDVRKRPFDDVRVRQAVNLAIDRLRVVELTGGPEVGQLTCQIVPTGFAGYSPYCPYTANAGAGRSWTAPDVHRARRLIAASGRRGARVVIHMPENKSRLGRYYARLLERLGFRTTLRIQSFDRYDVYNATTRATTGLVGWGADYLAAANFVSLNFGCGNIVNLSRLCDRGLEHLMKRARRAPRTDAAAWAAADRRVVDLAAAVPLTSRRSVVLVSKRAGNVKTHFLFFTLLDQMWVR